MDIASNGVRETKGHTHHSKCRCSDLAASGTLVSVDVSHLKGVHSTYEDRQLFASFSPEMVELRRELQWT